MPTNARDVSRMYLAALMFLTAHAARAEDVAEPAGASSTETLSGDVAVWIDAPLMLGRGTGASQFHLGKLAGARSENLGAVVPFHVVSSDREFVEVEPIAGSDCVWTALRVDPLLAHVRFFVRREDLAPVTTKPLRDTFADGTYIALEPGMPLVPTSGGYLTTFSGDEVFVSGSASIGHAYSPPAPRALSKAEQENGPAFALGAGTVTLGTHASTIRSPDLYPHLDLKPIRHGSHTLFKLSTACGDAGVLADSTRVREYTLTGLGDLVGVGGLVEVLDAALPTGTVLVSTTGAKVAIAAAAVPVPMPPKREKDVCRTFDLQIESTDPTAPIVGGWTQLRLCAAASKIKRVHPTLVPSVGGVK